MVRSWTCGDSQPGPKSECHTKEINVLFSSITAWKVHVSPDFGPFWSTRPTAAGNRPHTARLEALAIEVKSTSGVGTPPRDVIRHLCDPTGTRADYGPTAQNKIKPLGLQKGRAPFVAFRPFWPLKMDPSGASLVGRWFAPRKLEEKTLFNPSSKQQKSTARFL